ncbi:MAG: F0F1 ATP synthase subunit delta [Gracilibacteraceae bacterium]|jgi:F-type H+-transporting ATPase subunit delta|nr:F0F1 ATP synthase subunit delta [Gracilibacteraceae bacterium]
MLEGAAARRYAKALFELAAETGTTDGIDRELRELAGYFRDEPELKYLLGHPKIEPAQKRAMMEQIFGQETSQLTRRFFYLLLDRRRQDILPLIQREFSRLADEKNQVLEAAVTSAVKLSAAQQRALEDAVRRLTGKKVRLLTRVDGNLIGGAKLKIGDRVMDGTLAARLEKMRRELTAAL